MLGYKHCISTSIPGILADTVWFVDILHSCITCGSLLWKQPLVTNATAYKTFFGCGFRYTFYRYWVYLVTVHLKSLYLLTGCAVYTALWDKLYGNWLLTLTGRWLLPKVNLLVCMDRLVVSIVKHRVADLDDKSVFTFDAFSTDTV